MRDARQNRATFIRDPSEDGRIRPLTGHRRRGFGLAVRRVLGTPVVEYLPALVMVAVSLGLKARRKAVAEKPLVGADATAR